MLEQISLFNAKLELLRKTESLEKEEQERMLRKTKKITEKANDIRSKNAIATANSHFEATFMREEKERRELVRRMKEYATELGFTPITDVLENYEGKYNFIISILL